MRWADCITSCALRRDCWVKFGSPGVHTSEACSCVVWGSVPRILCIKMAKWGYFRLFPVWNQKIRLPYWKCDNEGRVKVYYNIEPGPKRNSRLLSPLLRYFQNYNRLEFVSARSVQRASIYTIGCTGKCWLIYLAMMWTIITLSKWPSIMLSWPHLIFLLAVAPLSQDNIWSRLPTAVGVRSEWGRRSCHSFEVQGASL